MIPDAAARHGLSSRRAPHLAAPRRPLCSERGVRSVLGRELRWVTGLRFELVLLLVLALFVVELVVVELGKLLFLVLLFLVFLATRTGTTTS